MSKKIYIIVGHFGSGKTEFSVNFAIHRARTGEKVVLCDLDIVNPYFRSREKASLLERENIKLLSGSNPVANLSADVPALDAGLFSVFDEPDGTFILDVGGDGEGSRVLSRFHDKFKEVPYEMYLVVNANRPQSETLEAVLESIGSIEASSRLKITGVISDTHMLRETKAEDIKKGMALCKSVSNKTGLKIVFCVVPKHLKDDEYCSKLTRKFIIDELYLRPTWL